MKMVAAYPKNKQQEKAIIAVLKAMDVPYEDESIMDETAYLLSTDANKRRLTESADAQNKGEGKAIKIEDLWK